MSFNKRGYRKGGMFEGATHAIFESAKHLRDNMTAAEMALWMRLRRFNEFKFRRQHPIGVYIADFYCHKLKLIIEVDGGVHDNPETQKNDELRQKDLERMGCKVLRFTNDQVLKHTNDVLNNIEDYIKQFKKIQTQNASPKNGV